MARVGPADQRRRASGDQEALAAGQTELDVFADQLGPERMDELRRLAREHMHRQFDQFDRAHTDRQTGRRQRSAEHHGLVVTDAQYQRWTELTSRAAAARAAGDADTARALREQRRALAERLGPEAVTEIRRRTAEDSRARVQRLRWTLEWQTRPHSRLSDPELTGAITQAQARREREQTAADTQRRQLADREPTVAAGHGPRVHRVDADLDQARQQAGIGREIGELYEEWRAVVRWAGDAAERAGHAQVDAERTRWWQPGRRERHLAVAAEARAAEQTAHAEAERLAFRIADLQQHLGGRRDWRDVLRHAERAEAAHPQDREAAQRADEHDLHLLRERITGHDLAAHQAATRHTELVAEQHLRDAMPEAHRGLEHDLRTEWTQQAAIDAAAARQQLEAAPLVELERDYLHRSIETEIDRDGPSLGL